MRTIRGKSERNPLPFRVYMDPQKPQFIVPGGWPETVVGDGLIIYAPDAATALNEISDEFGINSYYLGVESYNP